MTRLVERDEGAETGIQVDVTMHSGTAFSEYRAEPRPWPDRPPPEDQILAKFWHQVGFSKTVSRDNAREVLELVADLERLEDVGRLVKLLTV
jgi:hypothetical protein